MKRNVLLLCGVIAALVSQRQAWSQGCIVARSSELTAGPEGQGGYLIPGEWDVTIGYRHQFSFRHFVGPTEQVYRIQQGTQVMNKINLENLNVTYPATSRFSFSASVPLLLASRRSNNSPYTTASQGFGDMIFTAQGWLWNPHENTRGKVSFGLGVMFPAGNDHVMNRVDSFNGKGPQDVVLDYSIQPGSGGYGIVFRWQAFKNLPNATQAYFNGSYIATPQNTNGVWRSSIGVPIFGLGRRPAAAVSVAGMTSEIAAENIASLAAELKRTAARIGPAVAALFSPVMEEIAG